eukprot:gnl/TRDRNA2_/TRDRNA2_146030_c0_seq3.p1 gnl/TRDRNA2_/TRDRNA2_146030_c0~~gnl/TRDRNA2_/TRDRNA2_146030_c0_seq3.p1  ORF type:complete len:328 (+),score=43.90 gnl/TRDRNA2_/TRDRNA2_146030_c0_seq3:91-984(+)
MTCGVWLAILGLATSAVGSNVLNGTRHYRRGYKVMPTPDIDEANLGIVNITQADLDATPASIDWSAKGATTPINDQGDCGSCWAFSTMETVESAVFMSTGTLPPPLSVQQLVACDRKDGGCNGGDPKTGVRYLKRVGGEDTAQDYPDTSSKSGRNGRCKWDGKSAVKVEGFYWAVPECNRGTCYSNEAVLAAALAKYGPISISINSGDHQACDWEKYKGGILSHKCPAKANLIDHSVVLVGFNRSGPQPYWKIRNSWGKDWGEDGFIRIPMGENACCVGCEAIIISATSSGVTPIVV